MSISGNVHSIAINTLNTKIYFQIVLLQVMSVLGCSFSHELWTLKSLGYMLLNNYLENFNQLRFPLLIKKIKKNEGRRNKEEN